MAESEKKGLEDGSRKKLKTSEEANSEESHTFSEGAPKISELAANGTGTSERVEGDNAMATDEPKPSTKPNGSDGATGDKEEEKQDMKSIEDEFTQLKEKFFSDKIAAVKAEIEQVEAGVHEGIKSETKALESKRGRRIQLAEQIHRYQIESINQALLADTKCAEDEFIADIKELREKTLKTLNKKKKDLEEEKRDFSLADSGPGADGQRASTRTLRKRGHGKDLTSESSTPAPGPVVEQPKKIPEMRVNLTPEEMDSDMAQIQRGIINL